VSLDFFMDVHVRVAITRGLRLRNVNVRTAQEEVADRLSDPDLLDRATALGCVLFSQDEDLLAEGARWQATGELFTGIVYARQKHVPIGRCVDDLELMSKVMEPAEMTNCVVYLPL
jgi:hypothetical protein